MELKFTTVDSPLGRILIAATSRGISWLGLGESDRVLLDELRSDYPHAALARDEVSLKTRAHAVVDFLSGRSSFPRIALDVAGTPFQRRVWDELSAIPPGDTRSYGEIARRIAKPNAARAVGAAVGANLVAILIPCHRALRTSGALGGYRWGLERKRKLLELERPRTSAVR